MKHSHNIPTVLEGQSLYEAYCKLLGYVKEIEAASADGKVNKTGDTMSGNLQFSGEAGIVGNGDTPVTGIKTPSLDSDAATKLYVDSLIAETLNIDGSELHGLLEIYGAQAGIEFTTAVNKGIKGFASPVTGAGLTAITNIRTPVDDYDAATKEYVDNSINTVEDELDGKVSKSGDSLQGELAIQGVNSKISFTQTSKGIEGAESPVTGIGTLKISNVRTPVDDYDAATKEYVDAQASGSNKVSKSGDTMTGVLTMSAQSGLTFSTANNSGITGFASPTTGVGLTAITNVRTPVNDYDVATKKYVDEHSGGGGSDDYVLKAGDTMTGNLSMSENDITDVGTIEANISRSGASVSESVVTSELYTANTEELEQYISVMSDLYLDEAHISLGAGQLKFGRDSGGIRGYEHPSQGGKLTITGVATPQNDYDAATKKYIDDLLAAKEPFEVKFNFAQGQVTTTTNYADMVDAISEGREIVGRYTSTMTGMYTITKTYTYTDSTGINFYFPHAAVDAATVSIFEISYLADGTIKRHSFVLSNA